MASGVPLRQEGVVPIPAAPFAFPPSAGGGLTGIRHLPSPLQPLCVRLPNLRHRHAVLCRRDDFTLLASTPSIVEAEARTNQLCAILVRWADGKQLVIAPRKPAWPCSHPIPTSPDSTLRCESVTHWLRCTGPIKSWVSRWTPTSPMALTLETVSSEPWGPSMSWKL